MDYCAIAKSRYEKGGFKLVNELLKIPNDSEKLLDNLCLIFDIEKKDFDAFWRTDTLKFRTN